MPPPREEQASIGRISREPPARSPAIAESKARAQSLIPHVTELEAELSRERKERDTEAALMGEMLVRVAQAESEAKAAEARGLAAESRAVALEEASAVSGTRVSELSEQLDSARAAGERLRAEVERLEAELVEARSDARAASSSSSDEASEQVRAAEARARQEASRALLAEDMIEDLRHAMERGQQSLRDAETRAQGHAAELEEKLRAAEDRARWCDEAAKAATESSGLLDARVAELDTKLAAVEAKLGEAEKATAEALKATAEAEEAASLVSDELTETEKRLEQAEGEVRDGEARVQAAQEKYAKLREDVDGERAVMVTLEGQLAQTKDSAGRMKEEYESAMTSLRREQQQLLGQTTTQLETQIAELETQIAGARRALQDTQKRYEEARDRGNQARALHVAAEERATTLAAASAKASAALADLEKELTQDQAAIGGRARALAQTRELLGAAPRAEPVATSGASKSKPPPKGAPSPKPPPRGKQVKPPVPSMPRAASDEDVLSFDDDELDALTTPPTRGGS